MDSEAATGPVIQTLVKYREDPGKSGEIVMRSVVELSKAKKFGLFEQLLGHHLDRRRFIKLKSAVHFERVYRIPAALLYYS